MNRAVPLVLGLLASAAVLPATASAKVVNENPDRLPPGCEEVSEAIELTVPGGTEFATEFNRVAFTYDEREWSVPACAQVTVTFVNTDPIRHQFMVHGTYPNGSTLIEVPGKGRDTATWIAPSTSASLMVHCGVAQHQQKGMKAQFLVAGGEGDIPNIPGISGLPEEDRGPTQTEDGASPAPGPGGAVVTIALTLAGLAIRRRT